MAIAASILFAFVGAFVSARSPGVLDRAVRDLVIAHLRPGATSFFTLVSTVGSVTPMLVYGVILIAIAALVRRSIVPLAMLLAPVAAVPAYLGTKSLFIRTRPSGVGNAFEGTYSFPSAHATTSSAICSAVAYLLYREALVSRTAAIAGTLVICLLVGVSRIYLDVHWTTDIIGGWCLGIALAATTAALYEMSGGPTLQRTTTGPE